MSESDFDPDYIFNHHDATPAKLEQYEIIHAAAKRFATTLLGNVPACEDRAHALRLLRECTMTACAAISLDGRLK
jgi:hypothetical protein